MKVYNYISMLLLVGTAIFVSCSQDEEMSGENMDSLQSFQTRRIYISCKQYLPNQRARWWFPGYGCKQDTCN